MEGGTSKLRQFFGRNRRLLIVIGSALFVIVVAAIFWFVTRTPTVKNDVVVTPKKPTSTLVASLTNGVLVAPEIANRHPVAVMIENAPPARPQTGLTSADIVYEAVTEGGITRFMGIYSQDYPTKAGPVRSARSYFIDWLSEYDAFYVHAGGSPTALSRINQYGIKDSAGDSSAYHREAKAGLASEHTLYVDVSKIFSLGTGAHKWPSAFDTATWKFKDPSKAFGIIPKITLNFSTGQFQVIWTHDPATNTYSRIMGGTPHKDAVSGAQITAQTVIAMTVNHSPNPPYAGTGKESEWAMDTIGSGVASVFQDGTQINGTWKKTSRTERTRFYDSAGAEIQLDRGKIWVEVLPQNGTVVATSS